MIADILFGLDAENSEAQEIDWNNFVKSPPIFCLEPCATKTEHFRRRYFDCCIAENLHSLAFSMFLFIINAQVF